jgi:tRNA pseudouridine65 synthase
MLLHAHTLRFEHPYTQEALLLKASLDETFRAVFKKFGWDDFLNYSQ